MKPIHFVLIGACVLVGCKKADTAGGEDEVAKPLVQVTVVAATRGDISEAVSVTGTVSPLADHEVLNA